MKYVFTSKWQVQTDGQKDRRTEILTDRVTFRGALLLKIENVPLDRSVDKFGQVGAEGW